MEFKAEKNIPLPDEGLCPGAKQSPLRRGIEYLEPGDSIFVEGKSCRDVQNFVNRSKKMTGKQYTIRTLEDGVRIWRLM